jgi:hypothetical protein
VIGYVGEVSSRVELTGVRQVPQGDIVSKAGIEHNITICWWASTAGGAWWSTASAGREVLEARRRPRQQSQLTLDLDPLKPSLNSRFKASAAL